MYQRHLGGLPPRPILKLLRGTSVLVASAKQHVSKGFVDASVNELSVSKWTITGKQYW
jgi:hypothetical protein